MKKIIILFFFFCLALTSNGQNVIELIPFVKYTKLILSHKKVINDTVKVTCDLENKVFVVKSNSLDFMFNYERIVLENTDGSFDRLGFYVNLTKIISVSPESIIIHDNRNTLFLHDEAQVIGSAKEEPINKPVTVEELYYLIIKSCHK